jgi:ketosteroid isomerase-like protein
MRLKSLTRYLLPAAAALLLTMPATHHAWAESSSALARAAVDPSKRSSPKELLALLGKYIEARDVEAILAIHEPGASLVEFGGGISRGEEELRKSYGKFFQSKPQLKVNALQIVESGGVAIILGDYTLKFEDQNGEIMNSAGKFGDMVRQQPDGSWLYLLDNPFAP